MARSTTHTSVSTVPDAERLRQLYLVDQATVRELARRYHCRMSTLLRAMDDAGIVRRRSGRPRSPLPEWDGEKLQRLIKVKGIHYARAFAQHRGVNPVKLAALLGKRPLPRGDFRRHILLDHDDAIRAAYNDGISIKELAEQYGSSRRAIGYSLDRTSRKQSAVR